MFSLSLLSSIFNIARLNTYCSTVSMQKCLFLQYSDLKAYLPGLDRIKNCNSEYVKSWELWMDSHQTEPKSNSRDVRWSKAIMK